MILKSETLRGKTSFSKHLTSARIHSPSTSLPFIVFTFAILSSLHSPFVSSLGRHTSCHMAIICLFGYLENLSIVFFLPQIQEPKLVSFDLHVVSSESIQEADSSPTQFPKNSGSMDSQMKPVRQLDSWREQIQFEDEGTCGPGPLSA